MNGSLKETDLTGQSGSNPAENNQNQYDNKDKAQPAATIVAGPVKRASADAAEATQQRDYQNDEQYGSN